MNLLEMEECVFDDWLNLEVNRTRRRGYPHFDARVNVKTQLKGIQSLLASPLRIKEHRFHPFIAYDVLTPRYQKSDKIDGYGKVIREKTVKPRPIAYACHWDALIYSWYSETLTRKYEEVLAQRGIHSCVSAYLRKGLSNIESAHEAFEFIRSKGECTVLAFDLNSFYDTLDHVSLKRSWCDVLGKSKLPDDHYAVFKSVTQYHTVKREVLVNLFPEYKKSVIQKIFVPLVCNHHNFKKLVVNAGHVMENENENKVTGSNRLGKRCGIPQGSPISASLSNIYMLKFDEAMNTLALNMEGMYRRYSDDILFICPSDKAGFVKKSLEEEVRGHELTLNDKKSEELQFCFEDGLLTGYRIIDGLRGKPKKLQYLGFEFDGSHTYIRSSSFSRYQARLRARIKKGLSAAHGEKSLSPTMFKRKLFNRTTDKGKRNFITYAQRAAKIMKSRTITRQIRNNSRKVKELLNEMELEFQRRRDLL